MTVQRHHAQGMRGMRGMTLVELMVGLAIGLFIVSTALGLAMHQLQDDRLVVRETRLQLELQAAADRIVQDLRRAGHRWDAGIGIARTGAAAPANPYTPIDWSAPDATLMLMFAKTEAAHPSDSDERFGLRLDDGAVKMKIGNGSWQAVTDATLLTVTRFELTPVVEDIPLGDFCEQPCPASDASCPRQQVRRYDLVLEARSATDATVLRTVATSARVRNDVVTGACPA